MKTVYTTKNGKVYSIKTWTVGGNFGTEVSVQRGRWRHVLGRTFPYQFDQAAIAAAECIADAREQTLMSNPQPNPHRIAGQDTQNRT